MEEHWVGGTQRPAHRSHFEVELPYKTPGELPGSVTDHLPPHAQEIYMAAYNSAWEKYDQPSDPARRGTFRRRGGSREETAARIAWAAVKKSYIKDETTGKWMKK